MFCRETVEQNKRTAILQDSDGGTSYITFSVSNVM